MGGSSSKVDTSITNREITNFVMKLGAECNAGASASIVYDFGDITGDFTMTDNTYKQDVTVNFQCIQESMSNVEMQQKMATFLAEKAKSSAGSGLPWGGSSTEVRTNNYNEITSNLQMEDIKKCTSSIAETFRVKTGNVGGSVLLKGQNIDQTISLISKCEQIQKMAAKLETEINTKVDISADSEKKGIFGEIIGGIMAALAAMGTPFLIAGGVCCCIICLIVLGSGAYMIFSKKPPEQVAQAAGQVVDQAGGGLVKLMQAMKKSGIVRVK